MLDGLMSTAQQISDMVFHEKEQSFPRPQSNKGLKIMLNFKHVSNPLEVFAPTHMLKV